MSDMLRLSDKDEIGYDDVIRDIVTELFFCQVNFLFVIFCQEEPRQNH